jgi:glutamate-1-semialdehyde 2,1-aminomutase
MATLEQLADGRLYAQLESLGADLQRKLNAIPGVTVQRLGSVFWPFLAAHAAPLRSLGDLKSKPAAPFGPVFHRLLDAGIYLAPSAFEVGFLSAAHTGEHVDLLAAQMRKAMLPEGG